MLLHLIDGTSEDVVADYKAIIGELEAYGGGLAQKPRVTVLNKIDALDEAERVEKCAALETASGGKVLQMSGATHEGTTEVLRELRRNIDADRLRQRKSDEVDESWQP